MSDRAALLSAIREHPDEDTPRLVYADWLDEHGEAPRAAYIRAQVEHHRAAEADTATNTASEFAELEYYTGLDRVDWRAVDADLHAALAARKAAEKRARAFKLTAAGEGVPRVKGASFQADGRGFLGRLWVEDTVAFLKHADAIFRAAPITDIEFGELTAEQAREFVFSGHLARVRRLELSDADPDALRVLGSASGAAGVRDLEVTPDSSAEVVPALAAGRYWTGLKRLYAADLGADDEYELDEAAVAEMLARPQFRGLRALVMWGNNLDDSVAKVIATKLPELRHLDLALNPLTGTGGEALAASKALKHLRHLDLGSCEMEDGATAAAKLINTKNLPNLCVLKLDYNIFRGLAPGVLNKPGRGPTLRVLDLGDVFFTPADVEALVACPAVRDVWHLTLDNASLNDGAVEYLTRPGAFERLACLDLSTNEFGPRGAKALAAWPGAANLQWLDLSSNPIGESGAKALAASPHLAGVKYIRFAGRGTATLKKRFKKAFH